MWTVGEPKNAVKNEQAVSSIAMPSWLKDEYLDYLEGQSQIHTLQTQLQQTRSISNEIYRTLDELVLKVRALDPLFSAVDSCTSSLSRINNNIEATITHIDDVGAYHRIADLDIIKPNKDRLTDSTYVEFLNWTNDLNAALGFWTTHPTLKNADKYQQKLKIQLRNALNKCELDLESILIDLRAPIDLMKTGWPLPPDFSIVPLQTIERISRTILVLDECERYSYLRILKEQRSIFFGNTMQLGTSPAVCSHLQQQQQQSTEVSSQASVYKQNKSSTQTQASTMEKPKETNKKQEEANWILEDEARHVLALNAAINAKLSNLSGKKSTKNKGDITNIDIAGGIGADISVKNTEAYYSSIASSLFSNETRYFKHTHPAIMSIDIFIVLSHAERQFWEAILSSTGINQDDVDDAFSYSMSDGLTILLRFISSATKSSKLPKSDILLQTLDTFEHLSKHIVQMRTVLPRAITTNDLMANVMETSRYLSESVKLQISQYLEHLTSISSNSSGESKINEFILPFCVDAISFLKRLAEYSTALNSLDSSTVSELYTMRSSKKKNDQSSFIEKFLTKYANTDTELIQICTDIPPKQLKAVNQARQKNRSEIIRTLFEPSSSSPTQIYQAVCWSVGSALETAIDVQSSIRSSNPTICVLFLLNNFQYIHVSSTKSNSPLDLGKGWQNRCETILKHLRGAYLTVSWEKSLEFLSFYEIKEILQRYAKESKLTAADKRAIKRQFEGFNQSFDVVLSLQQNLYVPDNDLRSVLRTANIDLIVPVFKKFYNQLQNVEFTKKANKYRRYQPHYIEMRLNHFFDDINTN